MALLPIHESLLEFLLVGERLPIHGKRLDVSQPNHEQTYYSTEIQKRLLKPIGIKLGVGPIG